jgi:NADPH-dependent 2,4-dienoyl-CoA reductase/sulfur reductase-like enzyme
MISLGRPHIADPYWATKAKEERAEDIKRCVCCLYCIESMQNNAYTGDHGYCAVNPFVGEENYKLPSDGDGRKVMVIGAGPAGLTAAELMAKRGFKVTVYEKNSVAGGQVYLGSRPPHKEKLNWCIEDLVTACEKLGVEIKYSAEVTKDLIESEKPYAVICATGGDAIKPKSIEGTDKEFVYTPTEILNGSVQLENKKVAVIGSGMTGLETAELLTTKNNKVIVVEMADSVAPGVWMQHPNDVMPRLEDKGTMFYLDKKLVSIDEGEVTVEDTKTKRITKLSADAVVLALGVRSEKSLYESIKDMPNVYLVGDANKVGRIADATMSAYKCVKNIK